MQWVDTNVLVCFFTHDDPARTHRAVALTRRRDIRVAKTVLLETAGVLARVYDFNMALIVEAIRRLGGMHNVSIEDPLRIGEALNWEEGIDFADALHFRSYSCPLVRGSRLTIWVGLTDTIERPSSGLHCRRCKSSV